MDPEFTALPLRELADAALSRAQQLGADHADLRVERIRTGDLALHDGSLETSHVDDELGIAVRVVHDGVWGFAAGVELSTFAAARLAEEAVVIAVACRPVTRDRVALAPEPVHGE